MQEISLAILSAWGDVHTYSWISYLRLDHWCIMYHVDMHHNESVRVGVRALSAINCRMIHEVLPLYVSSLCFFPDFVPDSARAPSLVRDWLSGNNSYVRSHMGRNTIQVTPSIFSTPASRGAPYCSINVSTFVF